MIVTIPDFGDMTAIPPAVFSDDRQYRYLLSRTIPRWFWECDAERTALFVMLNPSTANATRDDPTIRRCMGYAGREKCTRLLVGNLSPLRATSPDTLRLNGADPEHVRDTNFRMVHAAASAADLVIVAWGAYGHWEGRDRAMLGLLADVPLWCLGKTKAGQPVHPLMQKGDAPLVPYQRS